MWYPVTEAYKAYKEASLILEKGEQAVMATRISDGYKSIIKPGMGGHLAPHVSRVISRGYGELIPLEEPIFLEPLIPKPDLIIFGGGHVGREVAHLADHVGFQVTIVDDRPEFSTRGGFPKEIHTICAEPAKALEQLYLSDSAFYLIVTRGHAQDGECLELLCNAKSSYLGMIGSKRKVAFILESMRDTGIMEEVINRIKAPVGLDLGGRTPAEIALSIVSEMVSIRYGTGDNGFIRSMSYKKGS